MKLELSQETKYPNKAGIWIRKFNEEGKEKPFEVIPTRKVIGEEGTEIQLYKFIAITKCDYPITNICNLFNGLKVDYSDVEVITMKSIEISDTSIQLKCKRDLLNYIIKFENATGQRINNVIFKNNMFYPINDIWYNNQKEYLVMKSKNLY